MSLRPAASLTLAQLRYDVQLAGVMVSLAPLPEPNHARALLPAAVRFEAAPGDEAALELTGLELENGDTATVLTGTVRRVHRGRRWIDVELVDAGAALAAARPTGSHAAGTAGDVVTALLGAVGVDAGDVALELPLAGYLAGQQRTAADHIALLCGLGGAMPTVGGDGAVTATIPPSAPDVAMLFGREVVDYRIVHAAAPAAVVVIGSGPAGSGQAPDALRLSAAPLPDGAPDPAPDTVWRATPVLRTPAGARTATDAAGRAAAASVDRLHARCALLPTLRPGMVVQVQELPEGEGDWLLTRVTHRMAPGWGATTDLAAVAAGAGGGGLLGALAGAAGGLL